MQAQANSAAADETLISTLLNGMARAWCEGDIEVMFASYWRDAGLRYANGAAVVRGFDAVCDNFRGRFSDRATMGQLSFSELEVEKLGPDVATAFGRWHIEREAGPAEGLFTLVLKRMGGRWLITSDHASIG